jgi:hypothetical protein
MTRILLSFIVLFTAFNCFSQGVNITSWKMNTTGHKARYYDSGNNIVQMTDSSDVQQVCYNNDTIYVRASNLASYIMGPWHGDPFLAQAKNHSYTFPRNPVYPSTTHTTLPTGSLGLLVNGVLIYTAGDGKSYKESTGKNENSGDGLWNALAWKAHSGEFDANGGSHPDPQGRYHNHSNPYGLYDSTNKTSHSPIIGWAFDGFPIYGPYGYATATSSSSGIKRMKVSYQLTTATSRTSGPTYTAYAKGYYIEDYEYVSGLGDLDEYNGRYCVTPEYPNGTYAYFLGTEADGTPSYPNILAKKFYGKNAIVSNFGSTGGSASKPKTSVSCYSSSTSTCNISIASTITSVNCNGGSTGAVNITVTGGTSPYSYSWSNSSTSEDQSNLAAGSYTVTVTDNAGCIKTLTATVTQSTAITITNAVTDVKCRNGSTGAINITVSGGTSPFTYSWSNTATTEDLSNIAAGSYTVTVTDSKSCIKSSTSTVSQPAAELTITKAITHETAGNDGAINITVSGGTSPYTYLWSNGKTTEDISGLPGGTYSVTVTDSKSCTKSESAVVNPKVVTADEGDIFVRHATVNPNPGSGKFYLTVKNPDVKEFIIYDIMGKRISGRRIDSEITTIELSGKGLYFIHLLENKNVYRKKIIVD